MPITINGTTGLSGVDGSAGTPALQGSDSNTGIAFGADTIIGSTGGSERFRVDSSGRLAVGTTSAGGKLHVSSGSSSALVSADADELIVENSGNSGITIASPNSGTCSIRFADPQNNDSGSISYNHNDETLRFATFSTERARITSTGVTLLGATGNIGNERLEVLETNASTNQGYCILTRCTDAGTKIHMRFVQGGSAVGSITTTSSTTAFNTSSDYRLKENIVPVTNSINRLQQLKPSRFNFIADSDKTVDGFIAHEVQDVVPEAIHGEKDAVDDDGNPIYQGIDQSKLVPLLTAALQEAIAKIESLETRLAALEVTP